MPDCEERGQGDVMPAPTAAAAEEVAPPVEQPHIAREQSVAGDQNRQAKLGADAYRSLALTGAFQSSLPCYRRRRCVAHDHADAAQPGAKGSSSVATQHGDNDMFKLDDAGQVLAVLHPDGTEASQAALEADART